MEDKKQFRNYPRDPLEEVLKLPQKIADEMGGAPFKRLLLAEALGTTPSSSDYRYLLRSSHQYGLTEGSEKSTDITLTDLGSAVTQTKDAQKRLSGLREAAMLPEVFGKFYRNYQDKRIPSPEMMGKILVAEYGVSKDFADECAGVLIANGRFAGIIRDISGSPHVLFDAPPPPAEEAQEQEEPIEEEIPSVKEEVVSKIQKQEPETPKPPADAEDKKPRPIFVGHGKNHMPLDRIEKILATFQIPCKVAIEEPNLGRPIPQKVRETMLQCGSAILIFTCDEKFLDEQGKEVWRPSENVVYELGAASLLYEDRIVIFKERGIHFPTNFQSIGYIEFDVDGIDAKAMDLLKELIGFGLVKVLPT